MARWDLTVEGMSLLTAFRPRVQPAILSHSHDFFLFPSSICSNVLSVKQNRNKVVYLENQKRRENDNEKQEFRFFFWLPLLHADVKRIMGGVAFRLNRRMADVKKRQQTHDDRSCLSCTKSFLLFVCLFFFSSPIVKRTKKEKKKKTHAEGKIDK